MAWKYCIILNKNSELGPGSSLGTQTSAGEDQAKFHGVSASDRFEGFEVRISLFPVTSHTSGAETPDSSKDW